MASPYLPPVIDVSSLPEDEQKAMADVLFEPSPEMHSIVLPLLSQPYASYTDLISVVRPKLSALLGDPAQKNTLHAIISAHPRLGEKKEALSASSSAEQSKLQGHEAEIAQLNTDYESKFPGLRYVAFVNGRGRPEIVEDIKWRIERDDIAAEERMAIEAMCDIAVDRAVKILRAARGEVV
ncbi:ohcu decarboxylase [Zalerion maritima]|uniref:Ohcu decarboxylase n=1 Tax=Zalerion maritima TaxID=339359 RepID=A0AAD5WXJ1_9PEZI|nr:ohcu decarboxylase [Zalerion maritima]